MPSVELNDAEWQQVIAIVSDAPWKVAHPLLMRIGGQLNAQALQFKQGPSPGIKLDANGKEVGHE